MIALASAPVDTAVIVHDVREQIVAPFQDLATTATHAIQLIQNDADETKAECHQLR